ncbi:hypothetical protein EV379_0286 [Microterricola gilva]|uniref:Uncharacterized protein n=1 Tax=Microterricola gilva TaxID=393267 RepID=A0A4Q8AHV5_9MICO|nr:hypothetical protein EV379_0286 [Microterricola gilva]
MKNARETFNWWLVLGAIGAGVAFIALGIVADLAWKWPAIITGTLTSIGSTFLLAFIIFVMERRFTRSITRKVEESTRSIIEAETTRLSNRLEDLEGELAGRKAKARSEANQMLDELTENLTQEALASTLDTAIRADAVGRSVAVPGSRTNRHTLLRFDWGTHRVTRGDGVVIDDGAVPRLTVTAILDKVQGELGLPWYDVRWEPGQSAVELVESLQARMRGRQRFAEAKALDFAFAVRELERALRIASHDVHADPGHETVRGQLRELLPGDWVVTSLGVENLATGYTATAEQLGFRITGNNLFGPKFSFSSGTISMAPDGVDVDDWEFVFRRAVEQLVDRSSIPWNF